MMTRESFNESSPIHIYIYYISIESIETQADSMLIVRSLDEYIEIRSRGVCIFDGNCIDAAHRSHAPRRIN